MKKVFNNDIKNQIAKLASKNNKKDIAVILENFINDTNDFKKGSNEYYIAKFLPWLKGETNKLPFNVFKIGNSKLPFLNFSTLPIVTCSGSGACETYCYSLKAWRYPASFLSQVQNTLLMFNFDIIKNELNKITNKTKFKNLDKIDFRLYVDGDFSTIQDLKNWMELIKDNKTKWIL